MCPLLGLWEIGIFLNELAPLVENIQFWGRYIDDIMFVWQGSLEDLEELMTTLNRNNLNIKLSYKASRNRIIFLDVLFQIENDGCVHSDVLWNEISVN